jgi:hypothetical protein
MLSTIVAALNHVADFDNPLQLKFRSLARLQERWLTVVIHATMVTTWLSPIDVECVPHALHVHHTSATRE